MKIYHQSDYNEHAESPFDLKDGELKEGDLVTNTISKAVWVASKEDSITIKPDTYIEHKKFRKMIPLI